MNKKEEAVQTVFTSLNEATKARMELDKQAREAKGYESQLKAQLQSLIPDNDTLAGIFHKVTEKPSVSYAKLYDKLLADYIPKTKHEAVEDLKKSDFTSISTQHSFKAL